MHKCHKLRGCGIRAAFQCSAGGVARQVVRKFLFRGLCFYQIDTKARLQRYEKVRFAPMSGKVDRGTGEVI